MRYLIDVKFTPVHPAMAKEALALLEATEAWNEKEKKAGRHIETWAKSDGSGLIVIVEVESNDVVYKKLYENPYWPFCTYTVTPLTDIKLAIETGKNLCKQMAKI
jgi:hypothetical protein